MSTTAKSSFFSKTNWKNAVVCSSSSWGETFAKTAVDLGAGITGASVGAFLGWAALPLGIAGNIAANKYGQSWARALSIGMMVAPVDDVVSAERKTDGSFDMKAELAEGKQRASNYFDQLKRKFGLHKIFKPKQASTSELPKESKVDGLGYTGINNFAELESQVYANSSNRGTSNQRQMNNSGNNANTNAPDIFNMSGLDDLNTPHII